jgi:hypothetical protein
LYDIDQARSFGFDGERAALNPRDVEQAHRQVRI